MTMRFEEVSERLGAVVDYPGNKDHGKRLNVAIPSLGQVRIWQAVHGGYSWTITFEPGVDRWTDEEKAKFVGYTASYRRGDHRNSSETIRIDGGPWESFTKAEEACKRRWQQIRNASWTFNIDLPKHAADKVARALKDVLQLTNDPGERLRIFLLASGTCIGGAGQALAQMAKDEGDELSELTAKLEIVKLLEVLVSQGAAATWKYLEDGKQ